MGNKSPDIQYAGSPIQDKMLGLIMPGFEKMFGGGGGTPTQQNLWDVPKYDVPGHEKISPYNVNQYSTQNYQVPGTSGMMPNAGWYSNLDPSIKQGLMEPTNEAARDMLNVMGGQGQMSARGGYSGGAQTALADLYSRGSQQAGMNAWNMISPIQQQQWGAQLGANQYGAEMGNQANRDVWGAQTGATQGAWNQNNVMNTADWQARLGANQYGAQGQLQQNMMPWSMGSNLFGGSLPSPVVSQSGGSSFMNNFLAPAMAMGGMYGLNQLGGKGG